jgi:hypothetical protein
MFIVLLVGLDQSLESSDFVVQQFVILSCDLILLFESMVLKL